MRRLGLIFTPLLVLLVLADPATAAATDGFEALFTQHFGRGIGADGGPCAVRHAARTCKWERGVMRPLPRTVGTGPRSMMCRTCSRIVFPSFTTEMPERSSLLGSSLRPRDRAPTRPSHADSRRQARNRYTTGGAT